MGIYTDRFLGCDPDTHACAIAVVDCTGTPVFVRVVRVEKRYKHMDAALAMSQNLALADHNLALADYSRNQDNLLAFAVEGQEIVYSAAQGVNPRSMLPVAVVAGAALQRFTHDWPEGCHTFSFPLPAQWKGQVPKQIHQARLCSALGWTYETVGDNPSDGYARPTEPEQYKNVLGANTLGKTDWKHVLDAIGLARYAREKYLYQQRVEANRKAGAL